jgi:hypothetical protein
MLESEPEAVEAPPATAAEADEAEARRRAQHAAAQRRLRQREAAGDVLVRHRFTPIETAKLHALGYLRDSELEDAAAIDAALTAMLANITLEER